ncbi:MAG: BamA/TamA family outer membrane protein, partial [Gammaproteobacteria bacterium]
RLRTRQQRPSQESSAYLTRGGIGTGIGLRYSTPIGPLRLDVGVPLARRSGVEDIVQIHVSIGQAF